MNKITGIILAGGKSRRMGQDKAFVKWQGKTFIERIIAALKPLVSEIIIVSDAEQYDVLGFKRIADMIPDAGPLSGIYTGLEESTTDKNIVLSCDVPLITTALLKLLMDSQADVTLFESNGKWMPLVAMYDRNCKDEILKRLKKKEYRVMDFIQNINTQIIKIDEKQGDLLVNINTPMDLKQIENEYSN